MRLTLSRRARCRLRSPQHHRLLEYITATRKASKLKVPRQEVMMRHSLHLLPQAKLSMPLSLGGMPQEASFSGQNEAPGSHERPLTRRLAPDLPQTLHLPQQKAAFLPPIASTLLHLASLSPHQGQGMRLLVLTLPLLFEDHSWTEAKTPDFFSFQSSEEEGIPQLVLIGRSEGGKSPRSGLSQDGPAPKLRQS